MLYPLSNEIPCIPVWIILLLNRTAFTFSTCQKYLGWKWYDQMRVILEVQVVRTVDKDLGDSLGLPVRVGGAADVPALVAHWYPAELNTVKGLAHEMSIFEGVYKFSHYTVPKIRFMYSQEWNCAASFQIPTFMYLWAIYKFPESVCIFDCSKIGRPVLRIYKSLTDT